MVIHEILFSKVILVRHGNIFFINRWGAAMKWQSERFLNRQLSWVQPGQGEFSPEARRGHSRAGWPKLAKQSRVFHTMCRHAGFWWGSWAAERESRLGSARQRAVRVALCISLFFLCILLISIVVVAVPFVCCSVKLPLSRPTSFCLFLSFLQRGRGGRAAAWPFCCQSRPNCKSNNWGLLSARRAAYKLID